MVEKINDYSSMTKEELIEHFHRSLKLKENIITLKEEELEALKSSFEELMYEGSFYEYETGNLIKVLRKENREFKNQLRKAFEPTYSNNLSTLDSSERLNNKDRIILLLKSAALTSTQLADKLGLSKQDTRTYLLRLKKENRIRVIAKKGSLNIYTAKPPAAAEKQEKKNSILEYDLSYLMNLMEVKMRLKEGENLSSADTLIITRIKDLILETKVELLPGKENFREEVNKKIDNLEAKINQLSSQAKRFETISDKINLPKEKYVKLGIQNDVKCQFCGYIITKRFPKDSMCPKCGRFSADLTIEKIEKIQPKQFETKTTTLSSKLKGKVKVKQKPLDMSLNRDRIHLIKGEYVKLLGITSTDRTQLFCSNNNLRYLLELTNNLDSLATGVLGGKLDKMQLVSEEDNIEEKCQFYVRNEIIYLVYGSFPDKKGKWLLEQMSNNYAELTRDKDVDNLGKFEMYQFKLEFKKRVKFILSEYLKLPKTFSDLKIPYVEDTIRIDYLGLSTMSIGIISLLLEEELVTELQMEFENHEEAKEMKESMITARIEAIAANTQGNTGVIPRWIAVKLGFQKYRFITFKKYQNDYFLSLLSEGNLKHVEAVEDLIDEIIKKSITNPFSGNLKPFSKLRINLERLFRKRRKFPPFNFDDELKKEKNTETIKSVDVTADHKQYCMYCGSKLTKNDDYCSICGTKLS